MRLLTKQSKITTTHKRFDQQCKDIAIHVPWTFPCFILIEIARSCGFEAWPDKEIPGIVWIRCNERQVEKILELTSLTAELMKVRSLENLAKVIFEAGESPPRELIETIELSQSRFLEKVWAEIDGLGGGIGYNHFRGSDCLFLDDGEEMKNDEYDKCRKAYFKKYFKH